MKILNTISTLKVIKKDCVLTIGNFDGLHIGHQAILATAKKTAEQENVQLVVMTFDPHPCAVLLPQKRPGILAPLPLKKHILAEFGVDYLFIVKTTHRLLNLSPKDFVQKFLIEHIHPRVVVEGESFSFGYDRSGNIATLRRFGNNNGFNLIVVGAKKIRLSSGKQIKVSSTAIRSLIEIGNVADAAAVFGRPYRLVGKIVPGLGKGKKLGFPTANMKLPQQLIPAEGVYAGYVEVAGNLNRLLSVNQRIPAAFSIGRPSIYRKRPPLLIEAHLLVNNVGRLYGKWLAMDFIARIRSQRKFKTGLALSAQIANDCKMAKKILSGDKM